MDEARVAIRAGLFRRAQKALEGAGHYGRDFRIEAQLLNGYVLERMGRLTEATSLARPISSNTTLALKHRAGAHYVLGRGAAIRGSVDDALQHFQTAE